MEFNLPIKLDTVSLSVRLREYSIPPTVTPMFPAVTPKSLRNESAVAVVV